MAENTETKIEIFTEILASDKLSAYQNGFAFSGLAQIDDPSWVWSQLFINPALAMLTYDSMEERDGIVSACLETRRNSVLSKPRRIKPASDSAEDKKIAAFVEETLFDYMDFDAFLEEAYDAIPKGVSIGEKIFADGGDRIFIERVNFHPQHYFTFDEGDFAQYSNISTFRQTGPLRLREGVTMDDWTGALLPEEKFYVFSYRSRYGNRWGTPLDRKCFWASWMKRASAKQWLKYLEKGTGVVVARYNDGAAEGEIETALDAATAMVEESAAAVPKKFLLEVHEMVRSVGSSHKEFVDDYCKSELAQIILGQTLTTRGSDGGGGNRALGQVHQGTQDDRTEVDSKALMASINHKSGIINDLVFWNFGAKVKRPEFFIDYETKEDINSKATRFGIIHRDVGMELSKKQVRDELELDEPIGDDDKLLAQTSPTKTDENLPEEKLDKAEFAEKKKTLHESDNRLNSKTERFQRLRPSMIQFSGE